MEKKLKLTLCVLIIILISIIAFVGVYSKNLVKYDNVLPKYLLSSEITGKRMTYLKVSTETKKKTFDKDGKEVSEIPEGANEEDYRKEDVKVNPDEKLTKENYKKVKEIFDGRLDELGVSDYIVRVDEENGEVVLEFAENTNTDKCIQYMLYKGDFSIEDSETKEELIGKADVKKATTSYGTGSTGGVEVYLTIKFTDEGAKKLSEVSKNYLHQEHEENEDEEEAEKNEEEQKKVTMVIEGSDVMTTYFGEELNNGELTITMGAATDSEKLSEYLTQAQVYAMLLNNGEVPIEYKVQTSEYIAGNVNSDVLKVIIGTLIVLALLVMIYMVVKFNINGALASVSFIAAIAMFLLMIRYTKTNISLGGIASMLVLIAVDSYFMIRVLRKIKENRAVSKVTYTEYLERLDLIIVLLIVAIVFTFMQEARVFSIGMILFYGIISIAIANLGFMRTMLIVKNK